MSDNTPGGVPPSPEEQSAHERALRATTRYAFSYSFDGTTWCGEVFATTWKEAEMKVRAMGRGRIDGRVGGIIPAGDDPSTDQA